MKPGDYFSDEDEDQDGESGGHGGQGGGSGSESRQHIQKGRSRDDFLSPAEKRRLNAVHNNLSKADIDNGKIKRKDREKARTHKTLNQGLGRGLGSSGNASQWKTHPTLDVAQFSGIDDTSLNPNNNNGEANAEQRNENELQYSHRYQPTPQFNPKPSPF